jgi:hypothetical protein
MAERKAALMEELQGLIADYCEEIKRLCAAYGLGRMNKVTIILRDPKNVELGMVISDDDLLDVCGFLRGYVETRQERPLFIRGR